MNLGSEILDDVAAKAAQLLQREGLDQERAATIGFKLADHLRKEWGGQQLYFPKIVRSDLAERDRKIFQEFIGSNAPTLAKKYGISVQRVYQIAERVRKELRAKRNRQGTKNEEGTP